MGKNEFIQRGILALMATPNAYGHDSNILRMSPARLIQEAQDMAEFVEQEGIPFDALPMYEDGYVHSPLGYFRLRVDKEEQEDPRPDTKEERMEGLKVRREELHKEMCDILDKNSVTNPSQLTREEMLKYFDANCELRYIRDQMDAIYKSNQE